jgi:hypothetical protein
MRRGETLICLGCQGKANISWDNIYLSEASAAARTAGVRLEIRKKNRNCV